MTMRLFFLGAGYSARALARMVADEAGFLGGTTRSAERFPRLEQAGIAPFLFDGEGGLADDVAAALRRTTHLVISAAPDERGDPVLRAAGAMIEALTDLEWIGYLSTVGVYGDHDGAWVDEDSPCCPASERSAKRLVAEEAWQALGERKGVPVAVLRLSGIYGPGRNAFANLERGTAQRIVKAGQVFNRIHVEDIAGALAHLARSRTGGVFNVTDDEPSPAPDVVTHAAGIMGVEPPAEVAFDQAGLGPMARSFYGETKRVSNARLKETGYTMRYPDYRVALAAMWRERSWRSEGEAG